MVYELLQLDRTASSVIAAAAALVTGRDEMKVGAAEAFTAGPEEKKEAADCGDGTGSCCLKAEGAMLEEDRTLSL